VSVEIGVYCFDVMVVTFSLGQIFQLCSVPKTFAELRIDFFTERP